MNIKIEKSKACGTVKAPPSKSIAHRLLICAGMAEGKSIIHGISECDDVLATIDCLGALGVEIEREGDTVIVYGRDFRNTKPLRHLNCRESGSTLRFLIPPAMLCGYITSFDGEAGLMRRPMHIYENLFKDKGLTYISDGESICVKGKLTCGTYSVMGNVSSQFISGLLFALPLTDGDSTLRITPPIESKSYINLTIDCMKKFGVTCDWEDENTIKIKGGQSYLPQEISVEGDYSGAAFIEALNLFGGEVEILGLNRDSIQGDSVYKKFYPMLNDGIAAVHIGDCPDLGPILMAVAAAKYGGVFSGTARLKIKESDRGAVMAEELKKFGSLVSVYEDSIVVYPKEFHRPTEPICAHNDHRIVMALSVLLTITGGELCGAEAISKSYPTFFEDLKKLGIGVTEI